MSQQGLRQASLRAVTSKTLDHNGDWHALFDGDSIAAGPFNSRMILWINFKLGTSYTSMPAACAALAAANSATTFSAIGTFDATTP